MVRALVLPTLVAAVASGLQVGSPVAGADMVRRAGGDTGDSAATGAPGTGFSNFGGPPSFGGGRNGGPPPGFGNQRQGLGNQQGFGMQEGGAFGAPAGPFGGQRTGVPQADNDAFVDGSGAFNQAGAPGRTGLAGANNGGGVRGPSPRGEKNGGRVLACKGRCLVIRLPAAQAARRRGTAPGIRARVNTDMAGSGSIMEMDRRVLSLYQVLWQGNAATNHVC